MRPFYHRVQFRRIQGRDRGYLPGSPAGFNLGPDASLAAAVRSLVQGPGVRPALLQAVGTFGPYIFAPAGFAEVAPPDNIADIRHFCTSQYMIDLHGQAVSEPRRTGRFSLASVVYRPGL